MQMECVDFVSLNQAKEKPLRFRKGFVTQSKLIWRVWDDLF